MKIGYLQRTSFIDYPGKLSAIIFTQGCNFSCPYCHNPELVDPAQFGEPIAADDVLEFLETRRGKLDGVVITGGEPTLHADLPDLIGRIRELGFAVKLDTNGTNPAMLARLLADGQLDYLAMDIKAPLAMYEAVAGAGAAKIAESIELIMASGIDYEFRTTLVEGVLSADDIRSIGELIAGARLYALQNFTPSKHLDESFLVRRAMAKSMLEELQAELATKIAKVVLR